MADIANDAIVNAINGGIRRGITVALENGCFGAAVILIYAGIDAMAFLSMPKDQEDVRREDFIAWADRYIQFPCEDKVTGADFYGARCGMLHNYSAFSRMYREGKCRAIGYMDKSVPEVRASKEVKDLVLVSIAGLAKAFFEGVDRFLVDTFTNKDSAAIAESRLTKLVHSFPANPKAK